jgi:hypothetical protein
LVVSLLSQLFNFALLLGIRFGHEHGGTFRVKTGLFKQLTQTYVLSFQDRPARNSVINAAHDRCSLLEDKP